MLVVTDVSSLVGEDSPHRFKEEEFFVDVFKRTLEANETRRQELIQFTATHGRNAITEEIQHGGRLHTIAVEDIADITGKPRNEARQDDEDDDEDEDG